MFDLKANRIGHALRYMMGATAIFVGASLATAVPANAFTLDGIDTSGDNYTESFDLSFDLDEKKKKGKNGGDGSGDKTVTGGEIRVGRDCATCDVFMLFVVPIEIVDNVYGDAAATEGSGWVKADGSPQGHSLGDLLGSDGLEFDLSINGGAVGVSVDYDLDSPGAGSGDGVEGFATSLQLNLVNGFGDDENSPDPILDTDVPEGWVQAVQYELQFAASLFEDGTTIAANDLSEIILHASPNKGKFDNKVTVNCCTPDTTTTVAEPGALSLLGIGLLGFALYRRRRSR